MRRVAVGLLAALLAASPARAETPEARVRAAVADVWGQDLGGGVVLDELHAQPHEVELTLHDLRGAVAGRIALAHPGRPGRPIAGAAARLQIPFSQVRTPEQAAARDAIQRVLHTLAAQADADLGRGLMPPPPRRWFEPLPLGFLVGCAVMLISGILSSRGPRGVDLRPNHFVPATIQVTLFSYWALYVPTVRERFVDIAAQLLFAYTLDAVIATVRGRPWTFRVAVAPIVFSTNLFMWYIEPWLQCTAITIALLSKELLVRRDGHIFNPSAFALSVLGLLTVTMPTVFPWGTPSPDVELNLPPNMSEAMLLLALIAQLRFPIVGVSLAAALTLRTAARWGWSPPNPWWPASLLILLLFATDPKTMPRRIPGRALYGVGLGAAAVVGSHLLHAAGQSDTYAKVVPIPLLNLVAPQLDRAGDALWARWQALVDRRPWGGPRLAAIRGALRDALEPAANRAHVLVWLLLAAWGIADSKASSFQAYDHWVHQTPGVIEAPPGDFPACADNPAWCRGFSFVREARAWLQPGP